MELMPPSIEKPKRRIEFLDALRGLAAIIVVYFHYAAVYFKICTDFNIKPEWEFVFRFGGSGVELFFIISGFVILMSLEKSKSLKDFIVSRFSRLYPPYWVAIFITTLSVALFPIKSIAGLTLPQTLVNILMFHTWIGFRNVDGVYWTLGLELVFYSLLSVLYVLKVFKQTTSKVFIIFNVLFVLQLLLKFFPQILDIIKPTSVKVLVDVLTLSGYGSLFMAGMLFYIGYQSTFTKTLIVQLLVCFLQYVVLNYDVIPIHCFITPLFFVLFYYCCSGKSRFIENKVLIFLGSISYSLYLIHANVCYGLVPFLMRHNVDGLLALIIVFVFVLIVAYLMHKFVEVWLSGKIKAILLKK